MSKIQYILVADSSSAKIYQSEDPQLSELTLVAHQNNPGGRMTRTELDADRPGMQRSGSGGTHSLGGDENSQLHESASFAKELAHWLHAEHVAGKFAGLMLVAPPHFLGDLRQNLSADCTKVLGKTVNKNLMNEGEDAIVAHLV